eukprot:CAMPEP_0197006292 /NCGR_PEP_ID=MMETSP1380-20130617/34082_1 /TAXON_ID=5936 /ORGANISM="Euplotes crassus, Strain CT5" /LENGTH=49 /DNA_ID= /DNA_START= /DNA_END= /DNA_ORIENTATION=
MAFVIDPLAFVDITVSMDESSLPIGFIVSPVALVFTAISPDLDSFTVSL